jgi:hypothetical protein
MQALDQIANPIVRIRPQAPQRSVIDLTSSEDDDNEENESMSCSPKRTAPEHEELEGQSPKKRQNVSFHPFTGAPLDCEACFDTKWWCRGCDGGLKILTMRKSAIPESDAKDICNFQFASCSKPFVPCYLCNRSGALLPVGCDDKLNGKRIRSFWSSY